MLPHICLLCAQVNNRLQWPGPPGRAFSGHQRFFLHRLDLLDQHVHLPAPVVAGAKPREVDGKDRVLPAAREPGAVVDQAQRAQRLDESQLAAVEAAELLVPVDQCAELVGALTTRRLLRVSFGNPSQDERRDALLVELDTRPRDVLQGPDGNIYIATEQASGGAAADGRVLRIEPAE